MVARITEAKMRLETADQATAMWNDTVLPALTAQQGFKGAQVLMDGEKGMAIVWFESDADAQAAVDSAAVQAASARFAPFFASAPERRLMDVVMDNRA
jgi:hypothetical protein